VVSHHVSVKRSIGRRQAAVALAVVLGLGLAGRSTAVKGASHRGGITRIVITSTRPAFGGATFGKVGAYELVSGTAYGTIDPRAARNANVAYLKDAPLDANGLVDYSMDFRLLRPVDAARGNGEIFYDVINRGGNPSAFGALNQGTLTNPGNGFLMNQGYEIAWSGWQDDVNPHTTTYRTHFPVATLPGGRPIVKRTLEVLIPDTPESGAGTTQTVVNDILTADIAYPPVSLDTQAAHVTLTVREQEADARTPLAASAVKFLGGNRVQIDLGEATHKGFDQGAIYELIYDGTSPWVGGMGFVSVRDLVSYLRNSAGGGNPARPGGMPVKAVIGWGVSQDGRFLRDFIWQGFNADLDGRRVFDGVIGLVSGAKKTDDNRPPDAYPFHQVSRWLRQHEDHDYPGAEFPFTYQTLHDRLTGRTDGILEKCAAAHTCPKIFQIDSDFETWHGHASLVVTDTAGHALTGMPDNVRVFQISGQQHGAGDGTPRALPICKLPSDPLDGRPVLRALAADMDAWVTRGVAPPASEYPNLTDHTLQTLAQAAATWPKIPGFPFNPRIFVTRVGNYSVEPPSFGASYPIYVPTTDAYGNPTGGVITPDLAAPLGTYLGRNFRKAGHAEDELCGGTGGFIAFAPTRRARSASGDSRPSVEELYPGGAAQFYARREAQIKVLIAKRLVRPEELQSYTHEVRFP
jgi:Alpha/beta hydrolase domain